MTQTVRRYEIATTIDVSFDTDAGRQDGHTICCTSKAVTKRETDTMVHYVFRRICGPSDRTAPNRKIFHRLNLGTADSSPGNTPIPIYGPVGSLPLPYLAALILLSQYSCAERTC